MLTYPCLIMLKKALVKYSHITSFCSKYSPYQFPKPHYTSELQWAEPLTSSPLLSKFEKKRLERVIGTLLYYVKAIDNTILVPVGTLASQQSQATQSTYKSLSQLLDYLATHPDASIRYNASDMILWVHSDASYLSESHARSRSGGYFYLSNRLNNPTQPPLPTDPLPSHNGPIYIHSSIMKNVMSSAAEAEVGALFDNSKEAARIRLTLQDMGHPQHATPIQVDNKCAEGIANDTMKQKHTKAMDMRFYWIKDRVRLLQFLIYWRKGLDNLGDYVTKHHPTSHHRRVRPTYVQN